MSFVEIGIERQYDARNIFEADRAFKKSCKLCSTTGKGIKCDRCGISNAHDTVALIFGNKSISF